MKILIIVAMLFDTMVVAAPKIITAPVASIFVPTGFDDNDNAEVIVAGNFPTACYKVGPSQATTDLSKNEITLIVNAYKYDGFCPQVITPFLQSVRVGILPSGQYKVYVQGSTITDVAQINRSRSAAPDDYLYAPVDNAKIEFNQAREYQVLTLEGTFPYTFIGCAIMKDIKVIHNKKNIVEILPIMELVDDSRCIREDNQFQVSKVLDQVIEGVGLIHVRVLNGLSYNRMFELQ